MGTQTTCDICQQRMDEGGKLPIINWKGSIVSPQVGIGPDYKHHRYVTLRISIEDSNIEHVCKPCLSAMVLECGAILEKVEGED